MLDQLEDVDADRVRDWVRTHFGISFAADQARVFEQRLCDFLLGFQVTPDDLLSRMQTGDRSLTLRFAEAMSTNYTYFFREPESFDFVAKTVLPTVKNEPLRMWCAAASSGDEPYSLAMLAREAFGAAAPQLVKILGTDLSERQLKAAEEGIYPLHQLAQVTRERLERWTVPLGLGHRQVHPDLKSMCTFRRLNLTSELWPFEQRFHVIFLRNVLYYFEPALRLRVLEHCYEVAEPGAWLITSVTEPMLDTQTRWKAVGSAIFRKPA